MSTPAQKSSPSTVKPAAPADPKPTKPVTKTKAQAQAQAPAQTQKPTVGDKPVAVREAAADLDKRVLTEKKNQEQASPVAAKGSKEAAAPKEEAEGTENEKAAANVAPKEMPEGAKGGEKDVTFSWSASDASSVKVTGSFAEWQDTMALEKRDGKWTLVKKLTPGTYEYKFIVDGNWWYDITLPTATDCDGNVNNVITV
ncbi:unnamed protein product [Chondrus crispus]|uniref:AMP-activated protein kinase glycogen-binding domain-containing protein n=1 Tax=Chondrus crispus TaxID=2769 RepID=R7QND7_CHOCR|nr:unnamed protein product [Chondrus crispus]CDF39997.1 unnamed protein product [Chondrus crispus]|eukprot:XP_005710291.1 unnamed protein product [Chondrus crispus]